MTTDEANDLIVEAQRLFPSLSVNASNAFIQWLSYHDSQHMHAALKRYARYNPDALARGAPSGEFWKKLSEYARELSAESSVGTQNRHGHTQADINVICHELRNSRHKATRAQFAQLVDDDLVYGTWLKANGMIGNFTSNYSDDERNVDIQADAAREELHNRNDDICTHWDKLEDDTREHWMQVAQQECPKVCERMQLAIARSKAFVARNDHAEPTRFRLDSGNP